MELYIVKVNFNVCKLKKNNKRKLSRDPGQNVNCGQWIKLYYICKIEFQWGDGGKQGADLSYFGNNVLTGECKAKDKRHCI